MTWIKPCRMSRATWIGPAMRDIDNETSQSKKEIQVSNCPLSTNYLELREDTKTIGTRIWTRVIAILFRLFQFAHRFITMLQSRISFCYRQTFACTVSLHDACDIFQIFRIIFGRSLTRYRSFTILAIFLFNRTLGLISRERVCIYIYGQSKVKLR